jgi:hypothetical protein
MRQPQKIVVHYLDGTILKGHARFFYHHQMHLLLETMEGEERLVPFSAVKAVFFVKSFTGDRKRREKREFVEGSPSFGEAVRVIFLDGETILGRSMNYRPEDRGFFLKPADPSSNNEMVFVPQSALRSVSVGAPEAPLPG